jgi:hypothetical protein
MRAVAGLTEFAKASGTKWPVAPILRFAFAGDKLTVSAAFDDASSDTTGCASVTVKIAATSMTEPRDVGFYGPQVLDILRSLRGRQVRFEFFDVGGPEQLCRRRRRQRRLARRHAGANLIMFAETPAAVVCRRLSGSRVMPASREARETWRA